VTIATDNFNRADSANRGANWTSVSGFDSRIASNEATPNTAGQPCLNYYNAITPGDAQYAKITLRAPIETLSTDNYGNGPSIRIATGADTGYITICQTGAARRFQVYRRIAGVETNIFGYTGATPAIGDVVELRVNAGFDLDLRVNGVSVATFTDTDVNKIQSGRVGDFGIVGNDFSHWDDWEGGDLVTAPPPDDGFLLVYAVASPSVVVGG